MKMSRYSSIDQFRTIVKNVVDQSRYNGVDEDGNVIFDYSKPLPTITFNGYVKIHGTNSGIGFDGQNYWAQSRERIITLTEDNAGFCAFALKNEDYFTNVLHLIWNDCGYDEVIVYGEWFGAGVQGGAGVAQLSKRFVVFDVCGVNVDDGEVTEKVYLDQYIELFNDPDELIYNKFRFNTYSIDIDFNNPELSINRIIDMTMEVENECPVAKYFGIDNGIGEGIVFDAIFNNSKIRFKSKGEKHSVSKVKKIVQVNPEVVESVIEFVEYAATENRLEQGIAFMKENNIELIVQNMSHYIKWVCNDVVKEESDVLVSNNLTFKQVSGKISNKAREYFFQTINKL